jgi:agmatinase
MHGFGDIPEAFISYDKASIAIFPVPYDETSTWIKGARYGPAMIIEASAHMELYDIETDSEVYRKGIFTDEFADGYCSPKDMVQAVHARTSEHLSENKFVVCLGGEHSISIGAVTAHSEMFDDLSVLQLDAHTDFQDVYNGSKYNHNCVMARIAESCNIVQVGIRSMDRVEKDRVQKSRVFFAHDIMDGHGSDEQIVSLLSKNVYVTLDLDVFDAAIMPATGTPEPGGLNWYQVMRLLKNVAGRRSIVGFDVVELCPNELSHPQNYLAAKLVYKLLSYVFKERKNGKKRIPFRSG